MDKGLVGVRVVDCDPNRDVVHYLVGGVRVTRYNRNGRVYCRGEVCDGHYRCSHKVRLKTFLEGVDE